MTMEEVYDFDEFYGDGCAELEAQLYSLVHHRETSPILFPNANDSNVSTCQSQKDDEHNITQTLNTEDDTNNIGNKEISVQLDSCMTNIENIPDLSKESEQEKCTPDVVDNQDTDVDLDTDYNIRDVNLLDSGESDNDVVFIPTKLLKNPKPKTSTYHKNDVLCMSEADGKLSKYMISKDNSSSPKSKIEKKVIVIDSSSESDEDDVVVIEPPPVIPICIDSSEELEVDAEVEEITDLIQNKTDLQATKDIDENEAVKLNDSFIAPDLPCSSSNQSTATRRSTKEKKSPSPSSSIVSDDFIQNDCEKLNITENNSPNFNFSLYHLDDDNSSPNIKNKSVAKTAMAASSRNNSNDFLQAEPFEFSSQLEKLSSTSTNFNSKTSTPLSKNISKNIYSSDEDNDTRREDVSFATPVQKTKKLVKRVNTKDFTIGANFSGRAVDLYESESSDLPESVCEFPVKETTSSKMIPDHNAFSRVNNISPKIIVQKPKPVKSNSLKYLGINMKDVHKNSMIIRYAKYWSSIKSFYDESWGGENFCHLKIISKMIGGRQNWNIMYNDINSSARKNRLSRLRCHNCQQRGHTFNSCTEPIKQILCYSCGNAGHTEPRCPYRLCLRCGSPSQFQVPGCGKCRHYIYKTCSLCNINGHIKEQCPDLWRRYHLSTDPTKPLTVPENVMKDQSQQHCSNCGRKGHQYSQCEKLRYTDHTVSVADIMSYQSVYPQERANFKITTQNDLNNHRSEQNKNTQLVKKVHNNVSLNSIESQSVPVAKRRSTQLAGDICKKPKNYMSVNHSNEKDVHYSEHDTILNVSTNSNTIHDFINTSSLSTLDNKNKSLLVDTNVNKANTPSWLPEYIAFDSNENRSKLSNVQESTNNDCNKSEKLIETNSIYLTDTNAAKLLETTGSQFLQDCGNKNDISVEMKSKNIGYLLLLSGAKNKQVQFRMDLEDWLRNKNMENISKRLTCPPVCLPRKLVSLKTVLKLEMDQLNRNLGNPCVIYSYIQNFEKATEWSKKAAKMYFQKCKDLNMILFGQLGYRDGKQHLNWLKDYLKRTKTTNLTVPHPIRKELTYHFEYIFSSVKHGDYEEILNDFKSKHMNAQKMKETILKPPAQMVLELNNEMKNQSKKEPLTVVELRPSNTHKHNVSEKMLRNARQTIDEGVCLLQLQEGSPNCGNIGLVRNRFKILREKIELNTFDYIDYNRLKMYFKKLKYGANKRRR